MSLMGLDVGTTGCKAVIFSENGTILTQTYNEYDTMHPKPGYSELDSEDVWEKIKRTIGEAASQTAADDPVTALSVASMGEAVVPVTDDHHILGPSILNFDIRGEEYVEKLRSTLPVEKLYEINGNPWGNQYGITKLMWTREHRPELYEKTYKLMLWGSFVLYMLGGEPATDYSLANRTLLFDLEQQDWSNTLLRISGIDRDKLPKTVPSGTPVGTVDKKLASELHLLPETVLLTGAHDQCANALGCGVVGGGSAMYGMGTFVCIVPAFSGRKETSVMLKAGLNTEHHAVRETFATFIYNMGGSIIKWFRDTYAGEEHRQAAAGGGDIYPKLFSELPDPPSRIMVLPHFAPLGPPDFIFDSLGAIVGLTLETKRGEVLRAIVEANNFSLLECINMLPEAGIEISTFRPVGGGSKSDTMVQMCADIMETPFIRPNITEAGALGAAILAGTGTGVFSSAHEGAEAMVELDKRFDPDPTHRAYYREKYEQYKELYPTLKGYIASLSRIRDGVE